jgi:transcriptional regulator with XRE-family HTH domain
MAESDPRRIASSLAVRFKDAGITQSTIASAIGVNQSQVSRVLSGRIVRHTKLLEKLCIYASSQLHLNKRPTVSRNAELMAALSEVWDGSDAHAHALAQVIRSLATLRGLSYHPFTQEEKPR